MHWIWRSVIISSLVGAGIFFFVYYSETGQIPGIEVHTIPFGMAVLLFAGSGIGLHALSLYYNRILPWNKQITTRFFLEVATGAVIIALNGIIFSFIFLNNIVIPESEHSFWQEYWDGAVKFGIIAVVIVYIYSLINFSIYSYNLYSVHQIARLRGERNQLHLQFEALKNQLSPHFLFNALNTISSLIYRDTALAEDFIRRLADTYRYILQTNKQKLIKVETEVEMLRAFFFMQKIKYEACIHLDINLSEDQLDSWIPPLTFQMLFENALKHNLISSESRLELSISSADGNYIEIKNNIVPKSQLLKIGNNLLNRPSQVRSHKIGLTNIRERYAFFTKRKIELSKSNYFIVKLPLIPAYSDQEDIL